MSFTVQTSGGLLDANAYIDAEFFKSYHDDRGNDRTGHSTRDIERAIVRASDYLDGRFRFVGEKLRTEQRMQWPRLDAEDSQGRLRSGVPVEVQEACAEYALLALDAPLNPAPARDDTGRVVQAKAVRVDVIEEQVTYVSGGSLQLPEYPAADSKLRASGLVVSGAQLRRA